MKRLCIAVLFISFFILSHSCDRYSGKRPRDYPPAIWVSEKPKMWFEIGEADKSAYTPPERIYGNLIMDGQSIEIEVFFNGGRGISFYEKSDATDRPTTRGDCTFGPDKLVVKIDKDRDNFLNGLCETITFIRVPKWIFDAVKDIPTESP